MRAIQLIRSTVLATVMALATSIAFAQPFAIPAMTISSKAFEDGGVVPNKYSMHYEGVQPDFTISGAPANTVSYAIIFHDIDVALPGTTDDVVHWIAWNIPSNQIAEGGLPAGSVEGVNAMRRNGYVGPGAPNAPRYHHYVFEFYALSENLELDATANKDQLLTAMKGKVVAKAAYIGKFKKLD